MNYKKADLNQSTIFAGLLKIPGVSVINLANVGKGCPDLLLGYKGKNFLIEIKNKDTKGKLTFSQKELHAEWKGQVAVAYNFDDVLKILEIKF